MAGSLGVLLDSTLSLEAQVLRSAFFQLQLWPILYRNDLATVLHVPVTSRLDHRNVFYVGLPLKMTQKLDPKCNSQVTGWGSFMSHTCHFKIVALLTSSFPGQIQGARFNV